MRRLINVVVVLMIMGWTSLLLGPASALASDEEQWFVSFYAGQYTDTNLGEILTFDTEMEGSNVYVLSFGKELGVYKGLIGYEIEGQVAWHTGKQTHKEVNAAFTLRWLPFPWDRYLDTSLAFGNGLSYATSDPELEIRESNKDKTNQFLYYILVETAFVVPRYESWDLFVRIHHRSSVYGLMGGIETGSNFLGVGLRYRF